MKVVLDEPNAVAGTVVFGKGFGTQSLQMTQLLGNANIAPLTIIAVDEHDDGKAISDELFRLTRERVIPCVGTYIGGIRRTKAALKAGRFTQTNEHKKKKKTTTVQAALDQAAAAAARVGVGAGVVVFSNSFEPDCLHVKEALGQAGVAASVTVVVEVNEEADDVCEALKRELIDRTGDTTIPSVWLGGKFVGGVAGTVAGIKDGVFEQAKGVAAGGAGGGSGGDGDDLVAEEVDVANAETKGGQGENLSLIHI